MHSASEFGHTYHRGMTVQFMHINLKNAKYY